MWEVYMPKDINLAPIIIAVLILLNSCSGGLDDTLTPQPCLQVVSCETSHMLWGYFQFIADPVAETLECIPLRQTAMHLNALPFLEPPPLLNLTLESLKFNGNIIEADIGLRHPFLGLNEFTGFDVCGIFITNGSKTGFNDPELRMATAGDTRLINPDGYSRWWNPAEFPHGITIFSYKDGLLGAPDSYADYNCTINGYKFFCDSLSSPNADVGSLAPSNRCIFSAGKKNIRHYTIELGTEGLIFNYAVDACWEFPQGQPPWKVPDDFSENANRPEAWHITITELENTLWNDGTNSGGDLSLSIEVWDHFNADKNTVKLESNGNFPAKSVSTPDGGGAGYSTYQIDILDATPAEESIELFISVESDAIGYGGALPGKTVTSYFTHTVHVGSEPPLPEFHPHWAGVGYNHANLCQNPNPQNINLMSLTKVWANTTSGSPGGFKPAGIAIADGKVYYAAQTGGGYYWPNTSMTIYCLDLADGHQIWMQYLNLSSDNGGRFQTSPFWYEEKIYVGGDKLYCFNGDDGTPIWEYDATPTTNLCAFPNHSPKVLDGRVYCTSRAGVFVCLNADTGAELWKYTVALSEMMPATDGVRVYYPSPTSLYCHDCVTGALLWLKPLQSLPTAWSGPVIYGDRVYQNSFDGYVNCYDKYSGDIKWVYDLPGSGYGVNASPAPFTDPTDGKTVLVFGSAYSNKGIWAVKDEGDTYTPFWNLNFTNEYYDCTATIFEDHIIMPDRLNQKLLFLDTITGTLQGSLNLPGGMSAQAGIAFDRLVIATFNSVECYKTN